MNTVLLQAGGGISSFLPIIGMIAIFYFFFIRPQQRKQKETKKYLKEIKKGDMVVTVGGIHGKIMEVSDTTVLIDVDRGTKLLVEKSSISLEAGKRLNDKQPSKEKK
ncbi:MAG: preprotein translocase subunit YajC [Ekhidna sp.]|nr:preprotein translocase subunit YajC [Ekhidna sp.]MBC6410054.1 preprotein translocase subunit YajC [Ekhidna sp.]MBC6427520.1 preprotein translocase subunit YajC [Ekhidna sp.]